LWHSSLYSEGFLPPNSLFYELALVDCRSLLIQHIRNYPLNIQSHSFIHNLRTRPWHCDIGPTDVECSLVGYDAVSSCR
jgi:hypothetical protein